MREQDLDRLDPVAGSDPYDMANWERISQRTHPTWWERLMRLLSVRER